MDTPQQRTVDLTTAMVVPADYGLKAANIVRLSRLAPRLGFSVPPGFILPPALLDALWRALGLEPSAAADLYAALVERCDLDLARAWQQRISLVDLPEAITVPLQEAYDELVSRTRGHAVVVRSSFHAEDRAGLSCAGIFESVPNVAGAPMLLRALRTVYSSLFAERTIRYLHNAAVPAEPRMSVIVQEMLSGAGWCGGVAHSCAPDLHAPELMLIAATRDLSGVTSGLTCPEEYLIHRPNLLAGRSALVQVTAGTATAARGFAFDENTVRPLARLLVDLEREFGEPLEVEWGRGLDGRIYVLQARPMPGPDPITRPIVHPSTVTPLLTGLAVGHGSFTGIVRRTDSIEEASHCGPEHVLVTRLTNPDWESALGRLGALVTESGGRTSHAARLARERRMLALVACGDDDRSVAQRAARHRWCAPTVSKGPSSAATTLETCRRAGSRGHRAPGISPIRSPPSRSLVSTHRVGSTWPSTRSCTPFGFRSRRSRHSARPPRRSPPASPATADVASFVRAKLRDALAVVCVAFPNARVHALPLSHSDAASSSSVPGAARGGRA
jgi:pyruvate, water dikinase